MGNLYKHNLDIHVIYATFLPQQKIAWEVTYELYMREEGSPDILINVCCTNRQTLSLNYSKALFFLKCYAPRGL